MLQRCDAAYYWSGRHTCRSACGSPPAGQANREWKALHDKEQTTMTDQQILAGPGEIAEGSKSLGLNMYAYEDDGTLQTVFSSPDMGQGPGAVAWLTGNFTGSGDDQIAQVWDHNGNVGVIGYGIVGETPQTVFQSPDLGQGSGALAFLTGDFTGSGHTEIGQVWEDNGNLGLIVYGYVNGALQAVYSNVIGFKPDALAFLTGDFLGFGSTQIAQLRDNGTLELLIYGSTEGTPELYTDLDMDQGPAALAFLAGDFTESGHTEIAQLWNNNGNLGLIVYGNVNGTLQTVYSDTDLFEGSGALAFLTGDFTGSGHTEIAQPWDNNGNLGLIIYGNDGFSSVVALAGSPDLGQGPGALAWLAGTFVGPGVRALIAQPWDN